MYRAVDISKRFGGVTALDAVSVEIRPGEVHGLLGANGAGKSTLVKILVGAERPSSGELTLDGERVRFRDVKEAVARGVAIVSQELNLFPRLDVLENLFLQREPLLGRTLTSRAEMRRRAAPVLEAVGFRSLPRGPLGRLGLGEQQLVEIARALLQEPRILFLDEPTSALQRADADRLLSVVAALRQRGVGIVYVSHYLEEVFGIADTITVMRDGRVAVERRTSGELTIAEAIHEMVGELANGERRPARGRGQRQAGESLRLEGIEVKDRLAAFDLEVRAGEIVGLAGVEGAGQRLVFDVLFGRQRIHAGRVILPGGRTGARSITAAVCRGIGMVPGDRAGSGLMAEKPVYENVATVRAGPLRRMGPFLSRASMIERARRRGEELGIGMSSPIARVQELSGGNQQKVVLAKWLEADPTVILLDDPTRGVDIAAKAEIHALIGQIASRGRVILLLSSELEEMVELCDRVIVFFQGVARGEMRGAALNQHRLLEATTSGRIARDMEEEGPPAPPGMMS